MTFLLLLGMLTLTGRASVDELIVQGDALASKGQTAKALEVFLLADRQRPKDAEVLRRIAGQYAEQMSASGGDKDALGDKALEYGRLAVAAGGDNSQAHLALAIVYGKVAFLKSPKERVEFSSLIKQEAQRAVDLDAGNDLAWHVLGRWNYEVANLSAPMKFFAQALYGKMPEASNEAALSCFERARKLNPTRLLNQAELGRTLAVMGRKDEARAALEKALAMPSREKDDPDTKARAKKALETLE